MITDLLGEGAILRLYDPEAQNNMKELFPEDMVRITYSRTPYEAVAGVNALLICTEWKEFFELDLKKIKGLMANPIIVDGRNIYNPEDVRKIGFEYYSVGRK